MNLTNIPPRSEAVCSTILHQDEIFARVLVAEPSRARRTAMTVSRMGSDKATIARAEAMMRYYRDFNGGDTAGATERLMADLAACA